MKTSIRISLLTLACMLVLWSCSSGSDTPEGEDFLVVMPTELTFTAEGGQQQVDVSSSTDWTFNSYSSWISIKRTKSSMTVTASANTKNEERTASVSINNGKATQTVTIRQYAANTGEGDGDIKYKLSDNTSIVDVRGITKADPEEKSILFPAFEADKYSLAEGSKIILNEPSEFFPNGLLARVTSVEKSSEGVKITYEKIKLEEAFETLKIEDVPIDLATNVTKIVDAEGNELPYTRTRDAASEFLHFDLPEVGWPFILGFELTPKMSIDVALKLQAIVNEGTFYTFNAISDFQVKLGADISAGLDLFEVGKHFHLLTIYFGAIPVGPVLVTPALDINAVLSASGKVSFEISTSATVGVSAGVHYDIHTGWSLASTPGKNFLKGEVSIGPKLEGSIGYGLGPSLRIGLYGDVVSVALACDFMRKESVSEKLDLTSSSPTDFFNMSFTEHLQEMELDISNYVEADAIISLAGQDMLSIEGPEVKFPGETYKMLPSISKEFSSIIQERADGDSIMNVSLAGWIKNKYALPSDKFIVRAVKKYELDEEKAEKEAIEAEIETHVPDLYEGEDSVDFEVTMELPEMHEYEMRIYMVDGESRYLIGIHEMAVMRPETDDEIRLRAILNDILKSRSGRWDGCDWDNGKAHIDRLTNLKREKGEDGKMRNIITIPKEWKLTNSLHIEDHTSGSTEFGSWILNIEESSDSELRTVTVDDPTCSALVVDNKVESYTIHSPLYKYATLPKAATTVDLSGSGIQDFSCCGGDNVCTPSSVNLENCKDLREVTFGLAGTTRNKLPQYSVSGCEKLEKVNLWNLTLEGADFLKASIGTPTSKLYIKECQIGLVSFPKAFSEILVEESKFNSLILVSNEYVTKFSVEKSTGESISVNNCSALQTLLCPNTGISSFSVAYLPSITYLNCSNNTSLKSIVPDVFDEMKAKPETSLSYDIRYEYPEDGEPIDKGYGFWYEGEPESGRHIPAEKPIEYQTNTDDNEKDAIARKILQDIYASKPEGVEWENCNWNDPSVPIKNMRNVNVDLTSIKISLKNEWETGPYLHVFNHGPKAEGFTVDIGMGTRDFTSVILEDNNIWRFGCKSTKECVIRSASYKDSWGPGCIVTENLEVSDFEERIGIYNYPKNVKISGSQTGSVSFYNANSTEPMNLTLKNCGSGFDVRFVNGTDVTAPNTVNINSQSEIYQLRFSNADIKNVYINKGKYAKIRVDEDCRELETFSCQDCYVTDEINLNTSTSIKTDYLNIHGGEINSIDAKVNEKVSIANTKIKTIRLRESQAEVIDIHDVDENVLESYWIDHCPRLCRQMTDLEMRLMEKQWTKGGVFYYDQRYYYDWRGNVETDLGYGLWCPGEPECGYHYRKRE